MNGDVRRYERLAPVVYTGPLTAAQTALARQVAQAQPTGQPIIIQLAAPVPQQPVRIETDRRIDPTTVVVVAILAVVLLLLVSVVAVSCANTPPPPPPAPDVEPSCLFLC